MPPHGNRTIRLARAAPVLLLALAALLLAPASAPGAQEEPGGARVLVTEVATPITPVVADHVAESLERARSGDYAAYVIELDTPGGLVTSMRDIVAEILASDVPVVVYVSPAGARAGSAGALITFASHVAVMAPGTTIGAATPIGLEGEKVPDKVVNDAAAQAEALAALRGRPEGFAGDTVREGRSATVTEALELGVVEALAVDLAAALAAADGRTVVVAGDREVRVATAGAAVDRADMGPLRMVLQALADPNVAFLLMTLGTLGLIYELATPGVGVAGATGAVCLLLAMFSLSVLPVNAVGLLLLALAMALFVAEVLAPGVAGFGFGGAVVLVLSSMFLFDQAEGVGVDLAAALPLAVVAFVLVVIAGRLALRARKAPSTSTGPELLVGRQAEVVEVDRGRDDRGRVFLVGSWWTVHSTGGPLAVGETVQVVRVDGLVLVVRPGPGEEIR